MRDFQFGVPGAAQSDLLIHFCGRKDGRPSTPNVPQDIRSLSPADRLDRILREESFRGFSPFGALDDQPMVCFSESPISHLVDLIKHHGFPPWGVVVKRRWVYEVGGGPIWYARQEQLSELPKSLLPWAVRFEAKADIWSDWTHEREWRVPVDANSPFLGFHSSDVVAVLVGDFSWKPTEIEYDWPTGEAVSLKTMEPCDPGGADAYELYERFTGLPPAWREAQIWFWHPQRQEVTTLRI